MVLIVSIARHERVDVCLRSMPTGLSVAQR